MTTRTDSTRGAKPKYKPAFAAQAARACELGATNADLAVIFGVTERSLERWLAQHAEFREAVKPAKEVADQRVERSLYERATGYSHSAVKIFADPKTGSQLVVDYVERYPPDPTSMIFWLKNRKSKEWRDRQEVGGKDGGPIEVVVRVAKEGRRITAS